MDGLILAPVLVKQAQALVADQLAEVIQVDQADVSLHLQVVPEDGMITAAAVVKLQVPPAEAITAAVRPASRLQAAADLIPGMIPEVAAVSQVQVPETILRLLQDTVPAPADNTGTVQAV